MEPQMVINTANIKQKIQMYSIKAYLLNICYVPELSYLLWEKWEKYKEAFKQVII